MQPLNLPFRSIAGYHLILKLGSGGMGDVYKAYHPELERTAAIKILHQPEMADRFRNEAYIQSAINHPNIARLYEYTSVENKPCIVMEFVDGDTLDDFLRRKTRLSNDEGISILRQITLALSYLHGKQIHHRDIKPQNFKVQKDGTVKMLDFGIAKAKYSPKFTREGFVVGTTEYMAPEQFEQRGGLRSDIWSLGVLAYEMMTGYMPFEAGTPAIQRARLQNGSYTNPRILIPSISDKITSIIDKCLRVNPKNRAGAAEILALIDGKPMPAERYTQLTKKIGGNRKMISIVTGCLLLLFLIMFVATMYDAVPGDNGPTQNIKPVNMGAAGENALSDRSIIINVPGINRAYLNFKDGKREQAPFEIRGKDGAQFEFTISADGYRDKPVQLELRMGPKTYDFILEKIN